MMKITVTQVLLNYGMPLVVLAKNEQGGVFLGINYDDPEDGTPYSFYFIRPRSKQLRSFMNQKVDLRYVILHGCYKQKYVASTWGDEKEEVTLGKLEIELTEEMLPAPRLFNPTPAPRSAAVTRRKIEIDGRWDVADLSLFSDLIRDCYAFGHALLRDTSTLALKQIFQHYPWRGGGSSLGFFRDLSDNINADELMKVTKMQYASPGFIEFSLRDDVADLIKTLIVEINLPESPAANSYYEAREYLRVRNWLTRSEDEIPDLSQDEKDRVKAIMDDLCEKFGLIDYRDHIFELSQNDELAGVKILLAFYRRLKKFADYSATGKAVEIFTA
ncbi:conserved protein of unknown function [Pseudomonas sp. JV551A1]|uniref:Uncharacterized protein n=2 Tax=Pseudomonas inefficax TaxID=2078786 RepID=A0AAQ1P4R9_9PSED|nr:hypothetical protein [Pseudomonas sp. JV551A1]SPO53208.1 conserved protein of unknown function [Pseudomonas sp. JV551A1]SPO59187.1 conserved protein of unknown function [Pseudomonas inefficax]